MKTYTKSWTAITVLVFAILMIVVLYSGTARASGPWYVASGWSDSNSCLSAGSPCATINGAIGKASSGDTVFVAVGTYTGTGTEIVLIDKDITLSGGWDTTFTTQSGMSTIDGQSVRQGINNQPGFNALVELFIVQNGSAWNGGGILNWGSLTLYRSAVNGNTANFGGGIGNFGSLTLDRSTINGNTASGDSGLGGGIYGDSGGIVTLDNSTVSGNKATQGGGIYLLASGTLNSSTVSGNIAEGGGGIYLTFLDTLTVQNSIFAGNAGGSGPDCLGTVNSLGYNLISDTSGCTFTSGTGDLTNINANLGPLVGSPGYHPLAPSSPAINAGNPAGCMGSTGLLTTDQRGVARVGICDIGAYEYTTPGSATSIAAIGGTPQHAPPLFPFNTSLQAVVLDGVGTPVNAVTVTFSAPTSGPSGIFANTEYTTTVATDGLGIATASTFTANAIKGSYTVTATVSGITTPAIFSLTNLAWYVTTTGNNANDCQTPTTSCASISAVLGKSGFLAGDTVFVASGTYNGTGDQVVLLDKGVTLSGGWDTTFTTQSEMSTIDGQGARQGIIVNSGVTASVERFILQNGDEPTTGGDGLENAGVLTLNKVHIRNNGNSGYVGTGIVNSGDMILNESSVTGNGPGCPGGIENNGNLTINNSTISGNTSKGPVYCLPMGGIANYGTLALNNSTVADNIEAGLANFYPGVTTLRNSIIAGNRLLDGSLHDCHTLAKIDTSLISLGYNLIGAATCTITATIGDQVGSSTSPISAKLFLLVGSPGYHPFLPGSPAIDGGNPAGCLDHLGNLLTNDQRGMVRPLDGDDNGSVICDVGSYELDPNNNPIKQVFLPVLSRPLPGILGQVTLNGTPIADLALELRFFDGVNFSTIATTTTRAAGGYLFTGIPSLAPGQTYYVRYSNAAGIPGRLWAWGTRTLTSYTAGTNVAIGDFDIADIALIAPINGETVALPNTFQWTPRPATPTDTYEFDLYDPDDLDPYMYTDPPLGYVGSFTLTSLPPGFNPGEEYVWEIWVYSPDGGFGISYETRLVKFSNSGLSIASNSVLRPGKHLHVTEDLLINLNKPR